MKEFGWRFVYGKTTTLTENCNIAYDLMEKEKPRFENRGKSMKPENYTNILITYLLTP
jgi:hypothetical protein